MAVSFGAGDAFLGSAGSSITVAFNAGTEANRLLVVFATQTGSEQSIDSATYNGVSMTAHTEGNSGTRRYRLFYLVNPASGSNNIVVNYGASCTPQIEAGYFYGVDQTTPVDTLTNSHISATNFDVTISSATGKLASFFLCAGSTTGTITWDVGTDAFHEDVSLDFSIGTLAGASPNVTFETTISNIAEQRGTAFNLIPHFHVDSAEFDREISSAGIESAGQLIVNASEFDREFQSIAITKNIVIVNSEFDREFSSAGVSQGQSIDVISAEFDREIGSVTLTLDVPVGSVEFDREFGSASISSGIIVVSPTFDYEAGSVALSYIYNLLANSAELDFEVQSVGLPVTGTQVVDSAEFGWEAGSAFMRQFMAPANTPKSRIKLVRICC